MLRNAILLAVCLVGSTMATTAQVDYKIDGARKVKAGYRVFPHDMRTEELGWKGLESDCLDSPVFGAWFDLQVKKDRFKFNVHTGGKLGTIENPTMYLGRVDERNGTRKLVEVKCKSHEGNEGVFSIEATGLDKEKSYFLLVASNAAGQSFAISAEDDFEPSEEVIEQADPKLLFSTIFGRVRDKAGKDKEGVSVSLLDQDQKVVSTSVTDGRGMFKFQRLEPDEVYITRIEAEDTELEVEMFLVGPNGKIKSRSTRIGDKMYGFGVDDQLSEFIRLLSAEDYALNVANGTRGVTGRVVDRTTFLFGREGIEVGLYSKERELISSSLTDDNGLFSFTNLQDASYQIQIASNNAKDFAEIVMVDDMNVPLQVANSDDLGPDGFFAFRSLPKEVVEMKRMEVRDTKLQLPSDYSAMSSDHPMVLRNIFFVSGSAELLPSSHKELDLLAAQLQENKKVRIEISGHTDDRGPEKTNLILSENRAKSVADYLVSKGVERGRLEFRGYGESKPVASNDTESGRRQNRRVEFIVLE